MKNSKNELFDDDLQMASIYFKALSHPARLAILRYLGKMKFCMSGDISNELPLSRTTVSQHLKELRDIGLIRGEIDGVKTNYCLDKQKMAVLKSVLGNLLSEIELSDRFSCESE